MLRKVYSVGILLAFFGLGLKILFFTEQQDISYIENRELLTNSDLINSSVTEADFQDKLDTVLMDQFPDRYSFVEQKNKVEYDFISSFYHLLDNDLLLNPIGSGYVNQIGNSQMLMTSPLLHHDEWSERISDRVSQINNLQQDYPDIDVYVYMPTQISQTDFFDEANGIDSAGAEYLQLFSGLEVPFDYFRINEFSDYPEYFYTTDHHWNNHGSYTGYVDMMNLMDKDNILEPLDENCHDGLKFYGTYSSQSGYVTDGCDFCVYKFDLPEYTMEDLNGEKEVANTNTFFDSDIQQSKSYYYNDAYVVGDGYTHIHADNDGETLLVIGDSYAGPVLPLFTSEFSDIWLIYPTNYKALTGEDFNYDEFIRDNDVDNIMIMYTIENYYLSDEWGPRYLDFDVHREGE